MILDVVFLGAGISGIGAACHLRRSCPDKRFAILERREAIGGTWDLFRYPGIRSDSDMATFGYSFRPWTEPSLLADGPSIRQYVVDTAREYDVERHVRFGRKVMRCTWSSAETCWTVTAEHDGAVEEYRARFLIGCTGYYNYDAGYAPRFPGEDDFVGTIVHPQHWPETLDYANKRVVVIGSGATAVTLVPTLARTAAHVTMLQRSPSYFLSVPAIDPFAKAMRGLPPKLAYRVTRARNAAIVRSLYVMSRKYPAAMRRLLLAQVRRQLAGAVDMVHFTPSYDPWDERLCVLPNGDLFAALRGDRASIVTDHVAAFTPAGIRLRSGKEIEADIVVKATGLEVEMLGGIEVLVDDVPVRVRDLMVYKGVLVENIPNVAIIFGYTNISWTLKVDLACEYVTRLLRHMDSHGLARVTPRDREGQRTDDTILGSLSSGYIQRAADRLPRQSKRTP
jgi:cation diffusion facilitator CzcD-associated flavoprotein CzcO